MEVRESRSNFGTKFKTKKIKYAIQYLIVSTLVQGKEDKTGITRQEFSTWFHSMDLKILLNIEKSLVEKRCCFEIGIGKVGTQKDEKNKLTELDQTLEDADSFGLDLEKVQKEIEATAST